MKVKNYSIVLDGIRCIAIILVVIQHTFEATVTPDIVLGAGGAFLMMGLYVLAHTGVPFFTILSGYLYLNPQKHIDIKDFYTRKLTKIVIPFILGTIFFFLWQLFVHGVRYSPNDILHDLKFLNVEHLYYLPVIAGLYLVTPFLRSFNAKTSYLQQVAFFSVFTALVVIAKLLMFTTGMFVELITIFFYFIPFIVYYYIGYLLVIHKVKNSFLLYVFAALSLMASIVLLIMIRASTSIYEVFGFYFIDYTSFNMILSSTFLFMVTMLFLNSQKDNIPAKSIIYSFARDSFGIYLVHPFLLDIVTVVIPVPDTTIGMMISLFGRFVVTIVFSWLLVATVRRIIFAQK